MVRGRWVSDNTFGSTRASGARSRHPGWIARAGVHRVRTVVISIEARLMGRKATLPHPVLT